MFRQKCSVSSLQATARREESTLSRKRFVGPIGWGFIAMTTGALGCTDFAPRSDVDVGLDQAQEPLEAAVGSDWSCLARDAAELVEGDGTGRAIRSIQVLPFAEGDDISAATVRACTIRDPDCLSPVADEIQIDSDGWADVPLEVGFDGYLEISAEGFVPTMLYYSSPLTPTTRVDAQPTRLVDTETAASFDSLFLMRDAFPTTAVINLRTRDCLGDTAPGIEYSLQPTAVGWYYVNGIPIGTAVETTESGVGGFSNVQAGTKVITARSVATGIDMAPPKSVFVRGGWFTNIRFAP